jgi:hypothetical protein
LIARDGPNYIGRVAGEGDIVVIADAATYQPGAALKRNRVTYYVVEDLGYAVDLISAQYSTPTKGGEPVTVSAGYVMRCPKADLAMEDM